MSLAGRRVLVTGGTGFIGSRLVRRLCAAQAEVHLLIRPSSSARRLGALWERVSLHVGDLEDSSSLADCARQSRAEFVFHLAKDRGESSFEKEAAATTRLAAVLKAELPGVKRWVRTAHAVRRRFGRGADAELCAALSRRFGLPTATLELYLVYGPGQQPGDFPLCAIRDALEGRSPRAPGGWKDFVFVDDVAQAYELAAVAPHAEGGAIQIGSGSLMPEAEVSKLLGGLIGGKKPLGACAVGPSEGHPADISEARQRLGWSPRTSLVEGLSQMIKWWREEQGPAAS